MIDDFKHHKKNRCLFYVVNKKNYDMIIRLSWLKKINLTIQ